MQIQNFKVYEELRRNMEQSILRQRKALKESIMKFVPKKELNMPKRLHYRGNKQQVFSERKTSTTLKYNYNNAEYVDDLSRQ